MMRAVRLLAFVAVLFLPTVSSAAMVTLDFNSGTFADELGELDTYNQDGFKLQVAEAGNHIDPVPFPTSTTPGPFFFHNNVFGAPSFDNDLILTFNGGAAFDFLGVNIVGFRNGAPSLELTASNGEMASFSTAGFQATPAFTNVTFVTFSIPFSGETTTTEIVDLGSISVDNKPTVNEIPEPMSFALLGMGGLSLLGYRLRTRRKQPAGDPGIDCKVP